MDSKQITKLILAVSCPTCGAAPRQKCELHSGQPRTAPHRYRRLEAAENAKAGYGLHNPILIKVPEPAGNLRLSRLSWKWRKRSSVKIAERTYEKRAQALHC